METAYHPPGAEPRWVGGVLEGAQGVSGGIGRQGCRVACGASPGDVSVTLDERVVVAGGPAGVFR